MMIGALSEGGGMKLGPNERYEIKAEAFRIITGHMAPGKDASPHSYPASYEERSDAWGKFWSTNIPIAEAMIKAFERVMPGVDGG
jgi:hypothetical protein